jgi:hypothetical protein
MRNRGTVTGKVVSSSRQEFHSVFRDRPARRLGFGPFRCVGQQDRVGVIYANRFRWPMTTSAIALMVPFGPERLT